MMSSLTGDGLPEVWETMLKYKKTMVDNELYASKRASQRKKWMWNYINDRLLDVRRRVNSCQEMTLFQASRGSYLMLIN